MVFELQLKSLRRTLAMTCWHVLYFYLGDSNISLTVTLQFLPHKGVVAYLCKEWMKDDNGSNSNRQVKLASKCLSNHTLTIDGRTVTAIKRRQVLHFFHSHTPPLPHVPRSDSQVCCLLSDCLLSVCLFAYSPPFLPSLCFFFFLCLLKYYCINIY